MKAIVPPETPGTTSAIPMAHPLSASTMYREKFMVCLRFLVLSVKIRISRIQKQTCLRFCQGGVSSAASKIGDKRRKPALRKLSFHQFFGNLPFFRTCLRSPRRDFPQSAPFLSECRAAQGAHSPRTALPDVFPFPAVVPGRFPYEKAPAASRRRSFRNGSPGRARIRTGHKKNQVNGP